MSTQTTNLNLSKAENTDEILSTLSANNDNWDTIDSAIYTNQQNISGKQATLVSGTNIKTINNESLLGSGNITISGGGGGAVDSVNGKTGAVVLTASDVSAQETLVSGTNIKTINSQSILGSGNLSITLSANSITAGTLGGVVYANSTAKATLSTSQIRNIYAGTTAMTSGTTSLATGDIYLQYE